MQETPLKHRIQDIQRRQRELLQQLQMHEEIIEALEGEISTLLQGALSPFSSWLRIQGQIRSYPDQEWEPGIHLGTIPVESAIFVPIEGTWAWTSCLWDSEVYRNTIIDRPAPFDPAHLDAVISRLTTVLGVKITLPSRTWKIPNPFSLYTKEDIQAAFPDLVFCDEGKIWFMGSDIPDRWVILQNPEGFHIFYSTDGQGFDVHLSPGDNLQPFLELTTLEGFEGKGCVLKILQVPPCPQKS